MGRLALVMLAFALAACAAPVGAPPAGPVPADAGLRPAAPSFAPYAVDDFLAPEAIAADLRSHPDAARHAEAIIQGAARGPAFAGFYAVAAWNCGPACVQYALIDGRNGRVILGPRAVAGAEYRHDSRLFVVDPSQRQSGLPTAMTRYFLWNGTRFVELRP